eukprot:11756926-Ditylum_brightwellii.AAC.1
MKAATSTCCVAVSSPAPVFSPTANENGDILAWNSRGSDGKKFKQMLDNSCFKSKIAAQIKKYITPFRKYATNTLNSALQNCYRVTTNKTNTKISCSNQNEAEKGACISAEDLNYFPGADKKDLSDADPLLSMNDNYSQAASYCSILAGMTVAKRDNKVLS